MESLLWLIPALPLLGAAINGGAHLFASWAYHRGAAAEAHGGHLAHGGDAQGSDAHGHDTLGHDAHEEHGAHDGHDPAAHATAGPYVGFAPPVVALLALAGPVAAFALAVAAFFGLSSGAEHGAIPALHATFAPWFEAGKVHVELGLLLDPLSEVMLLFVTGVGSLIHLYSYGYMKDDAGFPRFMTYLNLFLAAMIVLVMADSLPVLFVGWEGVGLCSYLLIGFWHGHLPNVDAGRKAFVVNRIGDAAFVLGMGALLALAGTLDFEGLRHQLEHADLAVTLTSGPFSGWTVGAALTLATACLFVGATGKSAQIPLHVWLPDAMAGPTPVSALIHAATMVTAGVYLVARMNFLYAQTPEVLAAVALVAAATALLSGAIAVAQNDIKKVLAYSTISQLGFMFAGVASAGPETGVFHVVTHAFFKALLFLGAGAVIHALHGEQDLRKMGGLVKDLRGTTALFCVGALALAGVPPFAGFFSKDAILASVYLQEGPVWTAVWWILVGTAGLTGFYTTRLVVLAFFGEKADPHRHLHPVHWTMTLPLVVLALLSLVGGALGDPLAGYTHALWAEAGHASVEAHHHAHNVAMGTSVVVATAGIALGLALYGRRRPFRLVGPFAYLKVAAEELFWWDVAYSKLVGAIGRGSVLLWGIVDRQLIDSLLVEGSGRLVLEGGGALRRTAGGSVSGALAGIGIGALVLLAWALAGMVFGG